MAGPRAFHSGCDGAPQAQALAPPITAFPPRPREAARDPGPANAAPAACCLARQRPQLCSLSPERSSDLNPSRLLRLHRSFHQHHLPQRRQPARDTTRCRSFTTGFEKERYTPIIYPRFAQDYGTRLSASPSTCHHQPTIDDPLGHYHTRTRWYATLNFLPFMF